MALNMARYLLFLLDGIRTFDHDGTICHSNSPPRPREDDLAAIHIRRFASVANLERRFASRSPPHHPRSVSKTEVAAFQALENMKFSHHKHTADAEEE